MQIRLINAAAVRALLSMERCIGLMRHAMALVASGGATQPLRQALFHPDRRGLLGAMPGFTSDPTLFGLKAITVYPGNFGTTLPSHQGFVLLFDAADGRPRAVIDATSITAIRTAAATAVATDVLARRDAKVLGILGYGEQAPLHLDALMQVRRFERVLVWGRDAAKARAFADAHRDRIAIDVAATAEEAVRASDVVCTLTHANDPVLHGRWLKDGQHVNAVGSGTPNASELDVEAVVRSRVFADYRDSVLALSGEIGRAKAAGAIDDGHVLGSIGDVIAGKITGRASESDITLFKSLGMIVEDMVAASFVLDEAERTGAGQLADWQ